jgi:hypothetical protein
LSEYAEHATTEFSHINIMDIDPSFKPVETGVCQFRVNKITPKYVTPGSGKNSGKEVLVGNGDFTIINSDKYSGRRVFQSFWASNSFNLRELRKLADVTGVTQEPGESLEDYLRRYEAVQPEFESFLDVYEKPQPDGSTSPENVIRFNQLTKPIGG